METIEGAPNFRKTSPTKPVYATAQPTNSGLVNILSYLRDAGHEKIVWINVREEPIVYVNGEPYVLRDQWATLRNIKAYTGISGQRVESMEEGLVRDVLSESTTYGGKILLHSEVSGSLIPLWEYLEDDQSVQSPKSLFHQHPNVIYVRLPVTAEEPPEPKDFDLLSRVIRDSLNENTAFVFNCQMGSGRSTSGAVIASQLIDHFGQSSQPSLLTQQPQVHISLHYTIVNAILRGIRNGLEVKGRLDSYIDEAAGIVNLREVIEDLRQVNLHESDPYKRKSSLRKSLTSLTRYSLLLLHQAFLDSPTQEITFSEWLGAHPEFTNLLHALHHKQSIEQITTPTPTVDVIDTVVHHRKGSVLSSMTILKSDHFPGCHRMSLEERVEGAPNFRGVALKMSRGGVNVYGVAMPTKPAIDVVLRKVHTDLKRRVVWVSLREEPVVFINGLPFVLRIVKDPISNVELTGIASERVEGMEERLVTDVMNEVKEYEGKILLHDDAMAVTDGHPDAGMMVAQWEPVDSIESSCSIYSHYLQNHLLYQYHRVPVTDEQSPIPMVFDHLRDIVQLDGQTDYIFNCQMGRGRTTTGMVITMIICLVRDPLEPIDSFYKNDRQKYIAGYYRVIETLIALLPKGRQAKYLVDKAIDACSHLQNLRECIYDYKQRFSLQRNPSERHRALNYLYRYFYLIAFAGFLLSSSTDNCTFTEWLKERKEIVNLINGDIEDL